MSRPPLIGLPGRRTCGRQQAGFHEILAKIDLDLYFADYARGVAEAGGIPVHLPVEVDVTAVVERIDGIVLPGGADIDPARYGEDPDPELLPPESERDELELALFSAAVDRDIPVLGICRGLQVINVHQGGTLEQHVAVHSRFDLAADTTAHAVSFTTGSALHSLYGPSLEVNSLHHQTVKDLGRRLEVTATATDGGIEGIEMGRHVLAVQWHPEMMSTGPTDPVFSWLVERARLNR